MKKTASFLIAMLTTAPALAGWDKVDGGVTGKPVETNSTIEALHIHCLEGPAIDLYSRDLGPVRPLEGGGVEADYFYKPGMISADVDGQKFPMVAAGSDEAVVLFSQGEEAKGYLAPVDRALFAAMAAGQMLTLSFDILPAAGAAGSKLETFARFDLADAGALIGDAVKACG
jgi:hypothetical protein